MNTINSSFKVSLSLKIVSLIVSAAFLCTTTAYGLDFSKSSSLRIPLMSVNRDTKQRSAIVSKVLQIFYEKASEKEEVKDKTGLIFRILSKTGPRGYWSIFAGYVLLVIIFPNILSPIALLPLWVQPLFEVTMLLPIRLTFTFLKSAFYKTYYNKSPVERAEFILKRLNEKARKRGDKEVLEVLSIVKRFNIVNKLPISGKVFDVSTGIIDISKGMTEQPALLQYMIMRRAFDMWWLSQPKVRRNIAYYSDLRDEVSEFLIRHSAYIGLYLIYELSLKTIANSSYKVAKVLGIEKPLSRHGEVFRSKDGVIYTVEQAVKKVVSEMARGKNKINTPEGFAKRFYFSPDMSRALLEILTSI